MKIAIHQPRLSYYVGGGERVPLEQARYLTKLGHEVVIITTDSKNKSPLFRNFVKKNPRIKIKMFQLSDKLKQLYKINLGQNRYRCDAESFEFGRLTKEYYLKNIFDLVVAHYTVDALKIPKNQKVMLHLHGCPVRKRRVDEKSLNRANVLSSVAEYVGNFWREMYGVKVPIYVAYNGIDNRCFHPLKITRKYDLLFVGRLIKIKGVSDLLRAAALVKKKKSDLKIIIVGIGPEEKNLQLLADKLKMNSHVIWAGSVADSDLLKLYNSSKISIFPSTAKEGVLTTMLEAAACGSAIITTNCCGMPEFLKHNKNGLLVEPRDPKKLASAIRRLLRNVMLRKRLGRNAAGSIDKNWTWEKRAKKLELIYKSCVKK